MLSCERDLLLARLILPGLRLVLATSQLSYVRVFSLAKLKLRDC